MFKPFQQFTPFALRLFPIDPDPENLRRLSNALVELDEPVEERVDAPLDLDGRFLVAPPATRQVAEADRLARSRSQA
jgi:hypothetical protein